MTNKSLRYSRRRFIQHASAVSTALVVPTIIPASALGLDAAVAPSNRISLGAIGIRNRGRRDLQCFLANRDVQFIAICDVQKKQRELIKTMADSHYGNQDCATYRNMHDMLARPDIDAVLIATGDRWHTMASITAAKAGKDVYCEKPCSMTIAESRALSDTFRKYDRIYQAGTQRRSIGNFLFATDLIAQGKLGKLHTVHANTRPPATSHLWLEAQPQPDQEEVDWDMWLGPCPWRPFNERYITGGWRGFFDFHGGGILEWGAHTVDLCQWAADKDHTAPVKYEPHGEDVTATYADGLKMVMRVDGWMGLGTCSVRYEGDEGWIETGDTGNFAIYPESLRTERTVFKRAGTDPTTHIRNFLDCVKTRTPAHANADVAAQSHVVCHAAYIAWQLGEVLEFDPAKEEFTGNDEANRMRSRAMREPWRV